LMALVGRGFHSLGVAVADIEKSVQFYESVGFRFVQSHTNRLKLLRNDGGLYLHLFQTTRPCPNQKNVLMDLEEGEKYPGHTHMSFAVGSVPKTRAYFEKIGHAITGTRGKLALFIRDPDRTVLEFERNDGLEDESADPAIDLAILSNVPHNGIDHIGTRLSNPLVNMKWYQEAFGLSRVLMIYEIDLENMRKKRPPNYHCLGSLWRRKERMEYQSYPKCNNKTSQYFNRARKVSSSRNCLCYDCCRKYCGDCRGIHQKIWI